VGTELIGEEREIKGQSVALKKELGLRDLVLTQIVFVVGGSWVGTAAKLGPSHLVFWLLAILLFYVPQAAVVIYLNRRMPLEGGLYQWAKLGFNEFAGFMTAWNLWLLAFTVMALLGLVVTTNISYAIGERAGWMQESKWFVALVGCVLTVTLVAASIRGLSLGKWVHNAGGIIMLVTYAALVVLPFISLARGELKEYHPLKIVAPAWSAFNLNIFTKMVLGALSGFEYVAILAGETRAPARNIGRSVIVAAPIIALMFILGTRRSYWTGSTGAQRRFSLVPNRRGHRFNRDLAAGHALDCVDEHLPGRKFAVANGGGLGSPLARVVYAFAFALQDAGQFNYLCRCDYHSLFPRQFDRYPCARSVSTRG